MQITLNISEMDTEALVKVGYAVYHDAAERGLDLTQSKAIVNEIESRERDRCWSQRSTDELREMIDSTEFRRNRDKNRDKLRALKTAPKFVGTDAEGNYWGYAYNAQGKRIRVCIPAR